MHGISLLVLQLLLITKIDADQCDFDLDQFRQEALNTHNKYRTEHSAPPLALDDSLNSVAQNYAQYLIDNDLFQHSDSPYGENLYYEMRSNGVKPKGDIPTFMWYNEVKDYNCGYPDFSPDTGHYTQLVWVSSKTVGVGVAISADCTQMVTVANYNPPGNVVGEFASNVICSDNTYAEIERSSPPAPVTTAAQYGNTVVEELSYIDE